jgi:hypothetical protein
VIAFPELSLWLPAQMSRIIRSLEARERPMIVCRINPQDKRKIDVCLTAAGEKGCAGAIIISAGLGHGPDSLAVEKLIRLDRPCFAYSPPEHAPKITPRPADVSLAQTLGLRGCFVVGSARGERTVAAAEFWPAYRQTALAPDELLLRIRIPLRAGRELRYRKIGTRRAQSISKVVMALGWRDGMPAAPWTDVRLALGSVAATPIRARATEAVLDGRSPTPETADRAAETLAAELAPIDDVRSTAEYRRLAAARVLHRLIREAGGW